MKKVRLSVVLFGTALFLSAVSVSPAFAALNVFLLNGANIPENSKVAVSVTGELLIEDMNAFGKPDILCSMIFDGTLTSGKTGTISQMLTLAGVANANLIECEAHSTCSNPVDVTAANLPWVLVSDFSDPEKKEGNEPTLVIDCNSFIGLIEDTCTGPIGGTPLNEVGGVLVDVEEISAVPGMNCTQGGIEQGLLQGGLFVREPSGGTFSVSEG